MKIKGNKLHLLITIWRKILSKYWIKKLFIRSVCLVQWYLLRIIKIPLMRKQIWNVSFIIILSKTTSERHQTLLTTSLLVTTKIISTIYLYFDNCFMNDKYYWMLLVNEKILYKIYLFFMSIFLLLIFRNS